MLWFYFANEILIVNNVGFHFFRDALVDVLGEFSKQKKIVKIRAAAKKSTISNLSPLRPSLVAIRTSLSFFS